MRITNMRWRRLLKGRLPSTQPLAPWHVSPCPLLCRCGGQAALSLYSLTQIEDVHCTTDLMGGPKWSEPKTLSCTADCSRVPLPPMSNSMAYIPDTKRALMANLTLTDTVTGEKEDLSLFCHDCPSGYNVWTPSPGPGACKDCSAAPLPDLGMGVTVLHGSLTPAYAVCEDFGGLAGAWMCS